jgi:hypothetical protein
MRAHLFFRWGLHTTTPTTATVVLVKMILEGRMCRRHVEFIQRLEIVAVVVKVVVVVEVEVVEVVIEVVEVAVEVVVEVVVVVVAG